MLTTNLVGEESGLKEIIDLFEGAEEFNIKHTFKLGEGKYVNTVIINGRAYCFANLGKTESELIKTRLTRRFSKLALYKSLSAYTEKVLPWGALTGIRPTKLAYMQLEECGEFEEFFTDTMRVSKEKTHLVKEILNTQKGLYDVNNEQTHLFVSIPFCPTRCEYCSFISMEVSKAKNLLVQYVDTLLEELQASLPFLNNLTSVYVGGGTPLSIGDEQLERILKCIKDIIGDRKIEYTVEAGRPDVMTAKNLNMLKDYGVTRICVNPQTFNDETLLTIGRKHTAQDILDKYALAKDTFDINMDLIAGLTGEDFATFKYSLDKAVQLQPADITVHTLALKAGSKLKEKTERLDKGEVSDMVDYAYQTLTKNGYLPYYMYRQKYMAGNLENVGYCKPNKACIYNIAVMEETSNNVAVGANAISKRVFGSENRIERCANPKDIATYIAKKDKIISDKAKLFS